MNKFEKPNREDSKGEKFEEFIDRVSDPNYDCNKDFNEVLKSSEWFVDRDDNTIFKSDIHSFLERLCFFRPSFKHRD